MSNVDADTRSRAAVVSRRLIPPLVWRRLPWWAELLTIAVGYLLYSRSRVAAPTKEIAAYFHSSQVWDLERLLHLDVERPINQAVSAFTWVGDAFGYYYGTLHFVVTPAVLVWLFLRRPLAYPRLRSTIMIVTAAALVVFWTWPLAPPRFALAGMTDTLVHNHLLNADHAQSVVNLYAAMPSLHVAWATWCAVAIYMTTSGRWRKLVWLYPVMTTVVVLGTANHFTLDAVGGVAAVALGLFLTRPYGKRAKGTAPIESIVTAHRDTTAPDAIVLDQSSDDGTMIDVRRPSAPSPPTDR